MLKKTEKINTSKENVKEINLTELWQQGELEEGFYYIRNQQGVEIDFYNTSCFKPFFTANDDEDIEEVLAEVPSYREYLESEAHCVTYKEENERLKEKLDKWEKKNAKLHKKLYIAVKALKYYVTDRIKETEDSGIWGDAISQPAKETLKQIEELDND